jgi:hypothetical protein
MLDIAKINGSDSVTGLIEENVKASPEVMQGDFRTIAGTMYKTLIRKNVPTGGFRNANDGKAACKSEYDNKVVQTYIADCAAEVDAAVADAHEDGPAALLSLEQSGNMEGMLQALSSQFYYGTANTFAASIAEDAGKGFPGLQQAVSAAMVVDAAGTTAGTGTSVWAVKFGPKYVRWVMGRNGSFSERDPYETPIVGENGKTLDGWRAPLLFWIGLQVVNPNAVAQIKNLTEDSGKGLDDDKLSDLLHKFPTGITPDAFFVTRRSRKQLQQSRQTYSPTGSPVPIPTEYEGIPLIPTDGIVDTENIV